MASQNGRGRGFLYIPVPDPDKIYRVLVGDRIVSKKPRRIRRRYYIVIRIPSEKTIIRLLD